MSPAGDLLALHVVAYAVDDLGVGQCRGVAEIREGGGAAMTWRVILPERVLGMPDAIQTFFERAILPISDSMASITSCTGAATYRSIDCVILP